MLAVFEQNPGPTSTPLRRRRKKVTLYPGHSLVFASHCNNLPTLPGPSKTRAKRGTINLPVVPLPLPSPDTFAMLEQYMYTKRLDKLFSHILPVAPTPAKPNMPFPLVIEQHAAELGRTYDVQTLLRYAMIVDGLWRNACALGVFDDRLWGAIEIIRGGLR